MGGKKYSIYIPSKKKKQKRNLKEELKNFLIKLVHHLLKVCW